MDVQDPTPCKSVKLPDGSVLSKSDLPSAATTRWVASRKALVVRAVVYGIVSQEEVLKLYSLSQEEFTQWVRNMREAGVEGLKISKLKSLRQGDCSKKQSIAT